MKTLWTVLITLLAVYCAGCPKDYPPRLSLICTMDGLGGGNCADPNGERVYKLPSEMLNYWATTQDDAANLVSWCYGIPKQRAQKMISQYMMPYTKEEAQE